MGGRCCASTVMRSPPWRRCEPFAARPSRRMSEVSISSCTRVRLRSGQCEVTTRSRRSPASSGRTTKSWFIFCVEVAKSAYFALVNFARLMLGAEEHVKDDQGGADGDGGVSDVERWVMVVAEADFEEIGDCA